MVPRNTTNTTTSTAATTTSTATNTTAVDYSNLKITTLGFLSSVPPNFSLALLLQQHVSYLFGVLSCTIRGTIVNRTK